MMMSNYVKGIIGMLVKQRIQVSVRIMIAFVGLAVAVAALAGVQSVSAVDKNAANTLKVSPVRSDVEIQAGESKKVQTIITNLTGAPITVRPVSNDFVARDEYGNPGLILGEGEFAPTHSLKRFMSPIADVTIPANQAKTVEVTITVPGSAQAGGYYGAVRFAPTDPGGGGQVNLNASVASLILLTVPGDVVEKLDLTDFNIQQGSKSAAYFSNAKDLKAAFRFQNTGGIQLGPFGKLSVKQGDKVVYETDFNNKTPRDVILTDSARRWDVPLKNIGSFGHYTVSATFTYGSNNQTVEVEKSFWIIPQAIIIAAIIGILVLIALIVGIWLFLRNYKRRVLRNHGHNDSGLGRRK